MWQTDICMCYTFPTLLPQYLKGSNNKSFALVADWVQSTLIKTHAHLNLHFYVTWQRKVGLPLLWQFRHHRSVSEAAAPFLSWSNSVCGGKLRKGGRPSGEGLGPLQTWFCLLGRVEKLASSHEVACSVSSFQCPPSWLGSDEHPTSSYSPFPSSSLSTPC